MNACMSEFEVPQPIICSPFEEPARHWHIEEGAVPDRVAGWHNIGAARPLRAAPLRSTRRRTRQWHRRLHDGALRE